MKTLLLIFSIVIAAVIGGTVGYTYGKSTNANTDQTEKLQDSVTMMKKQSSTITEMAEIMKTNGILMQKMGKMHNDEADVVKGKDLEMLGEKYLKDGTTTSDGDDSMKQMMGK